jgi:RsiW-degrading membrane proteinase PrsW (M82 family)
LELIFIIVISFLISFTWIYYFKMIDLFEREKTLHIVVTFLLGSVIPFIIYPIQDYVYYPLGISDSANPVYSFLFYVFAVGLLEEVIKFIPLFILLYTFKKAVNEPLDYVKYICVSALGFAFGENIEYAISYGQWVLLGRSILAVPGHMFFSTMFVYGYVEYKYHGKSLFAIFKYVMIAALSHGIYDFLLAFEIRFIGIVLNILFFFMVISAFITILNNNLNHSPFYSPKKVIDQEKVRKHLIAFYIPLLIVIMLLTAMYRDAESALSEYLGLMFWKATILYVLIVRLSRFSIVPDLKRKVRFELPFHYKSQTTRDDFNLLFGLLTVKGDSHNEAKLAVLYGEEVRVIPLSPKKSHLSAVFEGIMERKISFEESSFYILKLYLDDSKTNFRHYLLKAKTSGISYTEDNHPIVSLNSLNLENNKELVFHEWVILKKKTG